MTTSRKAGTKSSKTDTPPGAKTRAPNPPGCCAHDAPPPPATKGVGSAAAAKPIVRWEDEGGQVPGDDAARTGSPKTGGKAPTGVPPPLRPKPR